MRHINEIIIHCSATRPSWWARKSLASKVNEIRKWHVQDRGWSDIGYHYIIDRNGMVAKGRKDERVGAHVRGRNANTLGVCLLGGHGSASTDKFEDHFTLKQEQALRALLVQLQMKYPTIAQVSGHNQWAAKACPGFDVRQWHRPEKSQLSQKSQPRKGLFSWLGSILRGEK